MYYIKWRAWSSYADAILAILNLKPYFKRQNILQKKRSARVHYDEDEKKKGDKTLLIARRKSCENIKVPTCTVSKSSFASYLWSCFPNSIYSPYHGGEMLQSCRVYPSDWVNMICWDEKRIYTEVRKGVWRHIKYNQPGCQMVFLQL